jgi:hypothetical protein
MLGIMMTSPHRVKLAIASFVLMAAGLGLMLLHLPG